MNRHRICSSRTPRRILLIIFLATVIPTILVYLEHGIAEEKAYNKSIEKGDEYKATKQGGEAALFFSIAIGYAIGTAFIIIKPQWRIPYVVLIVGTIAIVILYYFRIYGIPVPFTDVIIRDISTDWRDVVTKIAQQIIVIPLVLMYKSVSKP